MNADYIPSRAGKHSEGIAVSEIRLGGEGHIPDVRQGLYFVGVKACLVEFIVIHFYIVVAVGGNALKAFKL